MGRQRFDLGEQIETNAQRTDDHKRTAEQQVPGANVVATDVEFTFVQIGNRQIGFPREERNAHQQQDSQRAKD